MKNKQKVKVFDGESDKYLTIEEIYPQEKKSSLKRVHLIDTIKTAEDLWLINDQQEIRARKVIFYSKFY